MSIEPLSDYEFLPRYVRVAEDLRSKLGSPGFETGTFLIGEHELSKAYKLSRGTIRKALDILLSEGLISRQPGRGTIILPPKAKPEAKRYTVAVIWNILRWLDLATLSSLDQTLIDFNCDIRFTSSQQEANRESQLLENLLKNKPDALVLYPTGAKDNVALIESIMQEIPVVLVHHYPIGLGIKSNFVSTTNEESVDELCQHFIDLGHKRIAFILWAGENLRVNSQVERKEGYLRAMLQAELAPLVLNSFELGHPDKEIFAKTLMTFIDTHKPTALIFHNDASAYRMYPYLIQHGLRIPEDISIAGFDGLELEFDFFPLELTTIVQPFDSLGSQASFLIRELLEHPNKEPQQFRLPSSLRTGNTIRSL